MASSVVGGVVSFIDAKAQAKIQKKIGKAQLEDRRRQTRRLLAAQQVAFAKAGVQTGAGTPLDVLGDSVAEEELAALRIKFSSDSKRLALKRKADLAVVEGVTGVIDTVLGAFAGGAA